MSKHPCFYPVKKTYLTPLQQMWDGVHAGEKISTFFPKFKRDITRAGELNLPLERQARAWAKDVLAGVIPRPLTVGEMLPPAEDTEPEAAFFIQSAVTPELVRKVGEISARSVGTIISAAEQELVEINNLELALAAKRDGPEKASLAEDNNPVKDAIDIIVDHYQQKAFAKARKEAAIDAAKALRFFADKVEASA